jgi:hypothetical protein
MCYSAPASFTAWGFAMASLLFLLYRGVPFRKLAFATTFSQMQLIEGLRWLNIGNESILAFLAKANLYLQPISLLYQFEYPTLVIISYILGQLFVEILYGSNEYSFTVAKNNHFQWNFISDSVLLFLPYFFVFGLVLVSNFKAIAVVWNILFLAYCLYTYKEHGTWGTIWCYWSNALWAYYLLQNVKLVPSMTLDPRFF